jgi:hypothetical protein
VTLSEGRDSSARDPARAASLAADGRDSSARDPARAASLLPRLARLTLTEEDRERVGERAATLDWAALFELAHRGGVAGMVSRHIEREGWAVPSAVRRRFAAGALHTEAQNRVQLGEARRLCAAAEERGLTLIPLKGAALNLVGPYRGDPALRPMMDLDLLARRRDVAALEALLVELSYREYGERESYLRFYHHTSFIRQIAGLDVVVELHWTALHVMFSRAAIDAEIASRSSVQPVEGASIRALDPAAQLLSVALHLAVHRYRGGLKWLVDVAELARARSGTIDWPWIWRVARTVGAERALAHVFDLAREVLDAPLPEPPASRLRPLLRALCPPSDIVESRPQPRLHQRLLINLLQYDSPVAGLAWAAHKGAEIVERSTGLARPAWLARHNLLGRSPR